MPERSPAAIPLARAYWPASASAAGIRETTIGPVLVTDSFPLTPSGKIRKDVLRGQLTGG